MTTIAFGSCSRHQKDPEQRVWNFIRSKSPDYLLLLGDQIYMDFGLPLFGGNLYEPRQMGVGEFASTMYGHYRTQFSIPSFRELVQSIPAGNIHCTWDDHDFAWNNAVGGKADDEHQVPQDKLRVSRHLIGQYRQALAARVPTYPPAPDWPADPATLPDLGGVQESFVVDGIRVILLDLRTWADLPGDECELLGGPEGEQERWLTGQLAQPEQEVILCSSLTLTKGTSWEDYPRSYGRLLERIAIREKKVLVLSGDIHVNRLKTHRNPFGGYPVHEGTSSGLAITGYKLSYLGPLGNCGFVTISPATIRVDLFRDAGTPDGSLVIDRTSWR